MQAYSLRHLCRLYVMGPGKIRVLLVEDHPVLRESLRALIETDPALVVVATAHNGEEGVRLAEDLSPDLIVMDVFMPVMSGLDALRQIRASGLTVKVIILTTFVEANYVSNSIASGADKFMSKDRAFDCLVPAILGLFLGVAPLILLAPPCKPLINL